ncbi:MAG: hypothetical protein J2P20_14850, partial [Pseudonocardia sp.]|nr:hypothetical protein [Pseudonocardia sp.]
PGPVPGPAGHGYAHNVAVTKTAPGWPAPNVECIELLLARGVRCVGTDGPGMGAAQDGAPVRVTGLAGGKVFIEGLANLASVPDNGAYFQFLPLKIARSSGGPGRAIAWTNRGPDQVDSQNERHASVRHWHVIDGQRHSNACGTPFGSPHPQPVVNHSAFPTPIAQAATRMKRSTFWPRRHRVSREQPSKIG